MTQIPGCIAATIYQELIIYIVINKIEYLKDFSIKEKRYRTVGYISKRSTSRIQRVLGTTLYLDSKY